MYEICNLIFIFYPKISNTCLLGLPPFGNFWKSALPPSTPNTLSVLVAVSRSLLFLNNWLLVGYITMISSSSICSDVETANEYLVSEWLC